MAHDYLFRRIAKASHAAWNWAFPAVPPSSAAATEEQIERKMLPDPAKIARQKLGLRAAQVAYVLGLAQRPLPVQQPGARGKWDSDPRPKRRAASSAYFINTTFVPPDAVATTEAEIHRISISQPFFRKPTPNVQPYLARPPIEENMPPSLGFITHRAPGFARTARTAYEIKSPFNIADPPPTAPGTGFVTHRAPGYRRTANDAYFIRATFVNPDVTAVVMPAAPSMVTPQFLKRRTANTAYWIALSPMVQSIYNGCIELTDINANLPIGSDINANLPVGTDVNVC